MLEILQTRHAIARILGYKSYADRALLTKSTTLRSVHYVESFLEGLATRTRKASTQELRTIARFAKKNYGIKRILPWDLSFLWSAKLGDSSVLDEDESRKYFPLPGVLSGLFQIAKDVFDCSFIKRRIKGWHPSVSFFEVLDARGKAIGGLYFDLIERDGKLGDACAVELVSRQQKGQKIQLPVACLVTNLRQAEKGAHPTLCHLDITVLFHEFGHIMHLLLSKNRYLRSGAFEIEPDAVELPSQLFEQWAWRKDTLHRLADANVASEKVDQAVDSMVSLRKSYKGFEYGEYVALSLLDWRLHKSPPTNAAEMLQIYFDAYAASNAKALPQNIRGANTFTHVFSLGYGANYYSYLWSECLVADLFAALKNAEREGDFEAVMGRYVKEVLAPGSARPFMQSFIAFRGRGPKTSFFFEELGLQK
jgi:oligopeptidase A